MLPGLDRVLVVYPVWLVAYGLIVALALRYRVRMPRVVAGLVALLLAKDVLLDFVLTNVARPRVYWAEHAPLCFWLIVVGLLGERNVERCRGHVGRVTLVLATLSLLLDGVTDLLTSCTVYGR